MKKRIVAGNWKMNMNAEKARSLFTALNNNKDIIGATEVIIAPPSIYLSEFSSIKNRNIYLASQNCSQFENGAYTGDISAAMLSAIEIDYCLVGHSERRQYHAETDDVLKQKIDSLLKHKVIPIFCCGENLEERESGDYFNVIKTQIEKALFHLSENEISSIVIAYEPVWAIGTGKTASAEQAQEVHALIRKLLSNKYGDISNEISILYGGSCKPDNAKEIFSKNDVDGGLIGGAALDSDSFSAIINAF